MSKLFSALGVFRIVFGFFRLVSDPRATQLSPLCRGRQDWESPQGSASGPAVEKSALGKNEAGVVQGGSRIRAARRTLCRFGWSTMSGAASGPGAASGRGDRREDPTFGGTTDALSRIRQRQNSSTVHDA